MAKFEILTVCTGNICRSPVAEQLLRARLSSIGGISISSAGTKAMVGGRMPDQAQALAREYGGEPSGHRPRKLNEKLIGNAQLVFAMSREHRREIVSLVPRASRYTFTIREFARLSAGLTAWDLADFGPTASPVLVDRLNGLVELVASRRGTVDGPREAEDDDVIDPYRRDDATYALSGRQIDPAVSGVVAALRLAATGAS